MVVSIARRKFLYRFIFIELALSRETLDCVTTLESNVKKMIALLLIITINLFVYEQILQSLNLILLLINFINVKRIADFVYQDDDDNTIIVLYNTEVKNININCLETEYNLSGIYYFSNYDYRAILEYIQWRYILAFARCI